jgi:hypothetical protein
MTAIPPSEVIPTITHKFNRRAALIDQARAHHAVPRQREVKYPLNDVHHCQVTKDQREYKMAAHAHV